MCHTERSKQQVRVGPIIIIIIIITTTTTTTTTTRSE